MISEEVKKILNIKDPFIDEYNLRKMEKAIYDVALELGAVYVIHKFMVPFNVICIE